MKYEYKYPMPAITADVIVHDRLGDKILLIKRGDEPYKDCWALPGGFFNPLNAEGVLADESIVHAARRELKEETNLDVKLDMFKFVKVQDAIGRDIRGRVVTFVYSVSMHHFAEFYTEVKAQDDAVEIEWISVREIIDRKVPLAFDHFDSIRHFIRTR